MTVKRITVIGAGNGGHAMAAERRIAVPGQEGVQDRRRADGDSFRIGQRLAQRRHEGVQEILLGGLLGLAAHLGGALPTVSRLIGVLV